MNFNKLIILTLINVLVNEIPCELIFEDNFDELNSTKWQIISLKGDCGQLYNKNAHSKWDEYHEQMMETCSTNNEINLRTISGILALTAKREKYFDSELTTATIASKQWFNLSTESPSLLFKIRASLPIVKGLIPRLYLSSHYDPSIHHGDEDYKIIKVIDFNGILLNGLANDRAKIEETTRNISLNDFNDYEIIFHRNTFIWRLNGIELIHKGINDSRANDLNFSYFPGDTYNLIITLAIDKQHFSSNNKNNSCHSFLIDFIKVFEYNESQKYHANFENSINATELCNQIKRMENQTYIKFKPEIYPELFIEEFDDQTLDENKWLIKANELSCENNFDKRELSCDTQNNIVTSDGKLKLYSNEETYLDHNFTGATISSRACYKNARIEISAKCQNERGVTLGLVMRANENNCHKGNLTGQVEILRKHGLKNIFQSGIKISKSNWLGNRHGLNLVMDFYGRNWNNYINQSIIQYNIYNKYGVEWSDSYILWFVNDRVIYQANRINDQEGKLLAVNEPANYFPFDHPFHLTLHIGTHSTYDLEPPTLFSEFYDRADWKSALLEIDYVKIYGEKSIEIETESSNDREEDSKVSNTLIIGLSVVILILLMLLKIIPALWKRRERKIVQAHTGEKYDDIYVKDDNYAEYQFANDYETVVYNQPVQDYVAIIGDENVENEYLAMQAHLTVED